MKLPVTVNIKYIAESDMPIMTIDSTHVITNESDISILADYVNMFSSVSFLFDDIKAVITECQSSHVSNIRNEIEWLSFSLI